jgi:ribosomal protein L11 methyltransferase
MADTEYLQFHLGVPSDQLERLAEALEPHVAVLWWDEPMIRISGLIRMAQKEQFEQLLTQTVQELACGPISQLIEPLIERDWLKDQQKRLPPLPIGQFWLYYSSAARPQAPTDATPLYISNTGAFGSGHHITTQHCLTCLGAMKDCKPTKVADVGCGSGVLSLAIASLWNCQQVAGDIEPKSVIVARENLRANNVHHVQTAVTNGFSHRLLRQSGPYDLIVANILTDIIADLAPDVDQLLTGNGIALLSGITASQCDRVLRVYEDRGFKLLHREEGNDWATIAVTRGS